MDPNSRKVVSSSSSVAAESAGVSSQSRLRKSETDQAADEFIRNFRENLKLQRLNSMAAAAARIDDFKFRSLKRSDGFLGKPNFEMDVDKSADEFINRFRQNLKIERKESLENYQEMLNRGV